MNRNPDFDIPDLTSDKSGSEDSSDEDFMDSQEFLKRTIEKVNKLKEEGNEYFCATNYTLAIEKYEKALEVNESIQKEDTRRDYYLKLKNNVAQCYLKRKMYEHALDAACDAIDIGSDQCKSYIRASNAFIKLDSIENAYYALKKGMFLCLNDGKDDLALAMKELQIANPDLKSIKDKNWSKISIKEQAEELKKERQAMQEPKKKKKDNEEKKRQARDLKTKEEEERKRKEDQERKAKEEEERRAKDQKKKDMEEQILRSAIPPAMSKQIKFTECIKKGSEAMQNMVAMTAFDCTGKALEILKTDYENLDISKNLEEAINPMVVTLRYIHARAGVETNNYDNIMVAKENYDLILNHYKTIRFPAVYLGLALLYKKLNRFEEARKYAEMGINYRFNSMALNWPGFPTQMLKETQREELIKQLENLLTELATPPPPDAMCKFPECTSYPGQSHILPSENIFLSDPDYRGHYKLVCSENCHLEYHKNCWQLLKGEQDWHVSRAPTEKDFIGKGCLTPDCLGVNICVEIYNQDGELHKVEDSKLMERLEEEAKKRKLEEKKRRLEEIKTNKHSTLGKAKKPKKKKKSPESPVSEDIDSSEHCPVPATKETANTRGNDGTSSCAAVDIEVAPASIDSHVVMEQVDYSKIDLSQATMLNKNASKQETSDLNSAAEMLNTKKKKAKKKEKVMSLQEFHASTLNSETSAATLGENDFDSRIQKANKYKSINEKCGTYPTPSVPGGQQVNHPLGGNPVNHLIHYPAQHSNIPWISQPSNRGVVSAVIPPPAYLRPQNSPLDIKHLLDYLFNLLKETGPLHYQDERIWVAFEEYKDEIESFDNGLKSFIYQDPENRFREHKDYICLLDDLAKLIKMQNDTELLEYDPEEVESSSDEEEDDLTEEKEETPELLEDDKEDKKGVGDKDSNEKNWMKIKELLGMDKDQKIVTNSTDTVLTLNSLSLHSKRAISSGTQTDVSSIDLEDGHDAFTLKQINENLATDLNTTKDQLFKNQRENKTVLSELRENNQNLVAEKQKLHAEISKLKDQNAKERKVAQDFNDKEKTLKDKNETLSQRIRELSNKLEEEQRLSFDLKNSRLKDQGEIKTLKIFNIKVEAEYYRKEIDTRLDQVKNFSKVLEEMRHNPLMTQLTDQITKAQVEVDNYSARLIEAQLDIEETLARMLNNLPQDRYPSLNFNAERLVMPKLDLNLFMFFLDIQSDSDRRVREAAAAKLQVQRGPPPSMESFSHPRPAGPRMMPGSAESGHLNLGMAPPPTSPLRGVVGGSGRAQGGPPPQASTQNNNTLAKLAESLGAGGDSLASNIPGFPVFGTSRANAFSPPLSRPSGSPSPFHTVPAKPSATPPTSMHGLHAGQRPMMPTLAFRPPMPGLPLASGSMMRPQSPGPHMGLRAGIPFLAEMPPPSMASGGGGQPVPDGGARSQQQESSAAQQAAEARLDMAAHAGEPGRKKNEDRLVDKICDKYQSIDREKARNYVKQVRQNNGGKLTGMNIPTILQKVQELASADESKDCSICLCELPDRPYVTTCGHQFHKMCLDQWLQQETSGNACPNCREFLTNDQEFPQLR